MRRFLIKHKALLCAGLLGLVSSVVLFSQVNRTEFQGDESGWISSGQHYARLLLAADFDRESWRCPQCKVWGLMNMQVGKLLIGLPLAIFAQRSEPEFFAFYDVQRSYEENLGSGRVPPLRTLVSARVASAVFGVLATVSVFVLAHVSTGSVWTGVTAAGLVVATPLFIGAATRATADIHYNLFLLSGALSTLFLLDRCARDDGCRRGSLLLAASGSGILTGLACAVKITGILIGGSMFGAVIMYLRVLRKLTTREVALSLLLFACVSLSVIYMSNPVFWPSTVADDLTARPDDQDVRLARMLRRYPQLASAGRLLEFPNLFLRWDTFLWALQRSGISDWGRSRFLTLHQNLLVTHSRFPFEWAFMLVGLAVCLGRLRTSVGSKEPTRLAGPLFFFLVNYGFILMFMEINWGRYYLPTVIASKCLVAVGLCDVMMRVRVAAADLQARRGAR